MKTSLAQGVLKILVAVRGRASNEGMSEELTLSQPFPRRPIGDLEEEKRLSAQIDVLLGFRIAEIEAFLNKTGSRQPPSRGSGWKQELWLGLAIQNLQTPYPELRRWLEFLSPSARAHWCDLGCAYARAAFMLARLRPDMSFTGYEFVGERIAEARRVASLRGLGASVRLEHQDLCAGGFAPPEADVYFIYDFGTPASIEKILGDLYAVGEKKRFQLIARGARVQSAIAQGHPWLREVSAEGISGKASLYELAK